VIHLYCETEWTNCWNHFFSIHSDEEITDKKAGCVPEQRRGDNGVAEACDEVGAADRLFRWRFSPRRAQRGDAVVFLSDAVVFLASRAGVQQGDPLGPLFSLALARLLKNVAMDDLELNASVRRFVDSLRQVSAEHGLQLNMSVQTSSHRLGSRPNALSLA
jgi:hypothetical protein